jgi:Holliday junction resolvase RusA-like endonuclease
MKRVSFVEGRPRFYHGRRMRAEEQTWAALLAPYRPRAPLAGPLDLSILFVYPHLGRTARKRRDDLLPKVSKPDCGNAAKHLEDLLTRMRFMDDDARVARLVIEKLHGPTPRVGIEIHIQPWQLQPSTVDGRITRAKARIAALATMDNPDEMIACISDVEELLKDAPLSAGAR